MRTLIVFAFIITFAIQVSANSDTLVLGNNFDTDPEPTADFAEHGVGASVSNVNSAELFNIVGGSGSKRVYLYGSFNDITVDTGFEPGIKIDGYTTRLVGGTNDANQYASFFGFTDTGGGSISGTEPDGFGYFVDLRTSSVRICRSDDTGTVTLADSPALGLWANLPAHATLTLTRGGQLKALVTFNNGEDTFLVTVVDTLYKNFDKAFFAHSRIGSNLSNHQAEMDTFTLSITTGIAEDVAVAEEKNVISSLRFTRIKRN